LMKSDMKCRALRAAGAKAGDDMALAMLGFISCALLTSTALSAW
jgi:hypothetical protein